MPNSPAKPSSVSSVSLFWFFPSVRAIRPVSSSDRQTAPQANVTRAAGGVGRRGAGNTSRTGWPGRWGVPAIPSTGLIAPGQPLRAGAPPRATEGPAAAPIGGRTKSALEAILASVENEAHD